MAKSKVRFTGCYFEDLEEGEMFTFRGSTTLYQCVRILPASDWPDTPGVVPFTMALQVSTSMVYCVKPKQRITRFQ